MKVLVFAKQIPDVNSIRYDPQTNRIIRENVPLSMNSFDRKAVEEAIRMKEKYGVETIVASMGPPQARDILNDSLRMGIDSAYLITDRRFGGSDTLATSRILSAFAKKMNPDLILTGRYSLDGETSQVPPEVAAFLGFGFRSAVSSINIDSEEKTMVVEQDTEFGSRKFRMQLPAVVSVSEKINRARAVKPEVLDMSDKVIAVDGAWIGINIDGKEYSPTVVTGTSQLESSRKVKMLDPGESVFSQISEIIAMAKKQSRKNPLEINLHPYKQGGEEILGVALGSPAPAFEIATKISELAAENNLNVSMVGNINPDDLVGMPCHVYHHVNSDDYAAVAQSITDYIKNNRVKYVIFPSNTDGRDIAATVAATLELGLTADCVDLKIQNGQLIQYKPAFGGNIIASIYSRTSPAMATVRQGMFRAGKTKTSFTVRELAAGRSSGQALLDEIHIPQEYVPLNASDIVIGFGRGVKKRDMVGRILKLANRLGAAVGATRPMVDMNFIPRQQQVGLTGMSISPAIYIALGISGQANHVVGIRYAEKVLAVNIDPAAEIFRYADYGLVMDINEFITGFENFLQNS